MRGALYLVNGSHPLGAEPERGELVAVDGTHPRILLRRQAQVMLARLIDAVDGGAAIVPVSGWRSQAEQQAIWDSALAERGRAFTETYVARPGCSEHQTGLAIDLGENRPEVDLLCPAFPDSGLCGALRRRAAEFGFVLRYPAGKEAVTGIGHEPWHFRYVGQPHAKLMEGRGLVLEEYLDWLRSFPPEAPLEGEGWTLCWLAEGETPLPPPGTPWKVEDTNAGGAVLTAGRWEA